jgi:hypothetical protein
MWIYGVPEIPVTADDIYWHSTKPTQPQDLFRISSEADQAESSLTYNYQQNGYGWQVNE